MTLPNLLSWILCTAAVLICLATWIKCRRTWRENDRLREIEARARDMAWSNEKVPGQMFNSTSAVKGRAAKWILTGEVSSDPPGHGPATESR
jgi:hypothetical protein